MRHMKMKGTPKALAIWERISPHFRVKLLNNAYCTHCRGVTSIADSNVTIVDKCLLIKGICVTCHDAVARVVDD